MIDPKGTANLGGNTAAAIASTPARTSKKLKHAMLRNSRAEFDVTYYNADEIIAQEHSAFRSRRKKLCLESRQPPVSE